MPASSSARRRASTSCATINVPEGRPTSSVRLRSVASTNTVSPDGTDDLGVAPPVTACRERAMEIAVARSRHAIGDQRRDRLSHGFGGQAAEDDFGAGIPGRAPARSRRQRRSRPSPATARAPGPSAVPPRGAVRPCGAEPRVAAIGSTPACQTERRCRHPPASAPPGASCPVSEPPEPDISVFSMMAVSSPDSTSRRYALMKSCCRSSRPGRPARTMGADLSSYS